MISYNILIPAYNSENTIGHLLDNLHELEPAPGKIIVVDDGSSDSTASLAEKKGALVLKTMHNRGKGNALKTGFARFLTLEKGDYLLCMDSDLQHPASSVNVFLQEAEKNKQFIIGSRKRSLKTMPIHRIVSNSVTSFLLSVLTKQKIEDSQCGYRLIHRNVLANVHLSENGFQLESEMILQAAKLGVLIYFVQIPAIYNNENSHIRNTRDTFRFVKLLMKELWLRLK